MISKYPKILDRGMVGKYPLLTKSGGGYFYDFILEYRVWVHPIQTGGNFENGDVHMNSFSSYEEALEFYKKTKGSEEPLALVLQKEYIDEKSEGGFEHIIGDRMTEWFPEWLDGSKRSKDSIRNFLDKVNKE